MFTDQKSEIWSQRLRMMALSRADYIRCLLGGVIVGLIFVLFHYQGNTTDVRMFGRSALLWMVERWSDDIAYGGDYSHGWLIPVVSLYVIYWKRNEFAKVPKYVSTAGLTCLILALLMHWMGAKAQQTRLSLFALIGIFWSIPFYLYGKHVAKLLIFPCAFLIFCVPLNFLDSITFPLRIFATIISGFLLNGIGIPVERVGSSLHSLSAGGFDLDVADPCSGIRSLMALTALSAVYSYFTQPTLLKKWLLFLCSIPLAMIANITRVTTIAIVAEAFGTEIAVGLYHDYSGYIVFSVAIILMIGVGTAINYNIKEIKQRWKHELLSPSS